MTTCLPSFRLRSRRNIPEDTQTIWATSSRWTSPLFKVDKPDGSSFYAVEVDIPDAVYLVKIDVDIDDYEKAEENLFDDDVEDAAGIDGEVFPDNGDDMQGGEDDQMDD